MHILYHEKKKGYPDLRFVMFVNALFRGTVLSVTYH